jgi:hypothetical protein
MTVRTIDSAQLRIAIPAVEHLLTLLAGVARQVSAMDVPAGVDGAVRARVVAVLRDVDGDLRRAAHGLEAIPDDLLRRVSAAQVADAPALTAAGLTLSTMKFAAKSFAIQTLSKSMAHGMAARQAYAAWAAGERYAGSGPRGSWTAFRMSAAAARDAGVTRGVPAGLGTGAKVAAKGLTWAGWGLTAYTNFRNPHLSTTQKVTRTGASIATGAGVSILAGAASGAAFGSAAGPLGAVVGFGAGTAWTIADSKLQVSRRIGDAAATAADAVGGAASDAGGFVAGGAKKALGVLGL